jgi:hypothetical protein
MSREEHRPDYGAGARPMRQRRVTVNDWFRKEVVRVRALPADEKRIVIPIDRPEQPR